MFSSLSNPAPGNILDPAHSEVIYCGLRQVYALESAVEPHTAFSKIAQCQITQLRCQLWHYFWRRPFISKWDFWSINRHNLFFFTQAWINNYQGLAVAWRRHHDQMVALQPHKWGAAFSGPGSRSDSNPRFEKHLSALNCSYKELGNTWLFSLCGYGFPFCTIKCH